MHPGLRILVIAAALASSLALAPVARAFCSLQDLREEGLPAELREGVDREVASRPERYVNGRARFWAVTGADGQLAGHLYGTLHISHGLATWVPPQVHAAFHRSRRLAVEVDAAAAPDRAVMRNQQVAIATARGESVSLAIERIAPGLLEPELRRYGITREQADRAGPFLLTRRISGARCLSGLRSAASLPIADLLFQEWARALGKPIHALESADAAIRATGLDQPRANQIQLLALALRRAQAEDAHVPALILYYARDRIDRAVAVGRSFRVDPSVQPAVEAFDAGLYSGRNAIFTDRLDRLLRREPGLFAAFGAGHLIGEDGVVARLRALGWTVEPLPVD